jgi:hypothetical protein
LRLQEAVMGKDLRVIEIGEGWAVRREGQLTLLSTHDSQQEAEHAALKAAKKDGVGVLVQGRDGRYRRTLPMGTTPEVKPRQPGGKSGAKPAAKATQATANRR